MTKAKTRKLIVYLITGIVYIHVSGFMAHYYNEIDLKKNPTRINKILLEPLHETSRVLSVFLSPNPPEHKNNAGKVMDNFMDRSLFYVTFFAWPFFVLSALIYWVIVCLLTVVLFIVFLLSLILSIILWVVIYVVLGFKIF